MKVVKVADQIVGTEPEDQVRSFVFMSNMAAQETAQTMDVSVSVERIHADLVGSTEISSSLYYVPDEWDEAQGWVKINYPLIDDTHTASLDIVLDATFQPLPGTSLEPGAITLIDALLAHGEHIAALPPHRRTTFHTAHLHPAGGLDDCDYCAILSRRGYLFAHEEIQQIIPIGSWPRSVDGVTVSEVVGTDFPTELLPGIIELQHRAALDVPHGQLSLQPAPWNAERLAQQSERITKLGTKLYTAVLSDDKGVVAMSSVSIPPAAHPHVAEQGLTIVHPRARGRGFGAAAKKACLSTLSSHHPDIQRVATSNAVDNQAMLVINRALGAVEISRTLLWEKNL
ncbi:hypothetical protein CDES_08715 [Corynebacterium deserti GIMN1.010]|uniref:N-acetyltransferase domain-containing protein n=1 Tax=Corynebacterium deserti GIMN1.010 TaxID=931089 RepID=A0A0M4CMA9_9CORY|nr:GNAT family protein [Corynebacterium deserti]ALC06135.1 hypothetical protein CDES_08715 [Corynebacterium deserti GIMN1.010]